LRFPSNTEFVGADDEDVLLALSSGSDFDASAGFGWHSTWCPEAAAVGAAILPSDEEAVLEDGYASVDASTLESPGKKNR
jgi:hypothetical protein